jgi:hypothetical protein
LHVPLSTGQGQEVSGPGNTHWALLPLQNPAQAPLPAQAPRWPCGAWPDGIGQQVPMWPDTSQAWQGPVQGRSQQTPSTQRPPWHCPSLVQATPSGRAAVHADPWQ